MYKVTDDIVEEVLSNSSLPLRLYPGCMYHPKPQDAWDRWENSKYLVQIEEQCRFWFQLSAFVRRHIKVWEKRKIDKSYCNKSDRNYRSIIMKQKFVYVGTMYV